MPTNTKALQVAEPAGFIAGKNAVINGGMDIWQRGTSVAMTTGGFVADRWQGYRSGGGATTTRQATADTTNLPNIQYCARVQRDSGNTGTTLVLVGQNFESINSIPFAGKTVTFSYYARAGANYSSASSALSAQVYTGTGTDQNTITGSYTGGAVPINLTSTLTTTWQRFTGTATLATSTTEICIQFYYTPVGTAGANDYFEVTGVQLELGSVATPFSRAGGTIQGELAACQRYYFRYTTTATGGALSPICGIVATTTTAYINLPFPVSMRTAPTSFDNANLGVSQYNLTGSGGTWTLFEQSGTNVAVLRYVHGSGIFTVNSAVNIYSTSGTAGYAGLSAEL